jgi:hypothetical protein
MVTSHRFANQPFHWRRCKQQGRVPRSLDMLVFRPTIHARVGERSRRRRNKSSDATGYDSEAKAEDRQALPFARPSEAEQEWQLHEDGPQNRKSRHDAAQALLDGIVKRSAPHNCCRIGRSVVPCLILYVFL